MNMPMAARPMRKLRDMEIDEISLVDRAANQHASILFSKSLTQEDDMPDTEELYLFDEDGQPVDADDLEFGDVVYSEDGEELVIVPDDAGELEDEYYEEPELVGKASPAQAARLRGYSAGVSARQHIGRHRGKYGLAAGAAGGVAAGRLSKSLGEVLVEELSKSDRDERELQLAGALGDEIEKAQAAADEAYAYAEQLEDERATEAFISKAAEYNLPVDPVDLGLILKAAATVLDDDQLDLLDQLFEAIGDDIYDEIGVVGDTDNSDVLSQVDLFAEELVGKSDGGLSMAEASTLLFEQNPEAYEMYLRENGGV